MEFNRRKTRKFLFQKLYSSCFAKVDDDSFNKHFFDDIFKFSIDRDYFNEMFSLIIKNEWVILEIIQRYAPKFDLKKMHIMYILPMFICIGEMLYLKEEIPGKVSINESVEIAKAFWDTSAKRIVNWVLNKVYENIEDISKDLSKVEWEKDFSLFKN